MSATPAENPSPPTAQVRPVPPAPGDQRLMADDAFQAAFGEPLSRTLDLETWLPGEDLQRLYERLEQEVKGALSYEDAALRTIRSHVLPRLAHNPHLREEAGVYRVSAEDIARVHRLVLFNGGVEAADGTFAGHDTLAMTITQVGVCLVSYQGDSGSWVHRLYRRDLRAHVMDPVEEVEALLVRRQRRTGGDERERRSQLSTLAQRAILAYAERAALLDRSNAPWRMGHGNPVPVELLSGSGYMALLDAALPLLRRLIGEHRKIVYVPSEPREGGLLTIGHALQPLEYAVIDTMQERLSDVVERYHYDRAHFDAARDFVEEIGPQLVIGAYRVSTLGPPRLFYAHREHVHEAALIAMADSALQEHRAFPMLIDLADTVCHTIFGPADFRDSVRLAYLDAGHPYSYLGERETRER
ncbi:MAG: hypothetical protein KatS3mg059_1030 [Thermomicrobiales bacterium]|nr:MAG: hypothetical protein KatS3mg059_1030 [Thermomicrobiales bacterium]